jgi:outer membrane protein assembly factor BamD (BamD/ComL family)
MIARLAAFALLTILIITCGCSKNGPSGKISSAAFDSAPAPAKQLWSDAVSAWKSQKYAEAANKFVSLQSTATNLSTAQKDELTKAMDEFGQEAFNKANNGDPEATKAVLALKEATSRRAGGR